MFLFVLEMIRVKYLLECPSPRMYVKKRKRIELAMMIATPIIISLGGLQIMAHIAYENDSFQAIHPLFAKYSGLILACMKTPTDVFVTVLFFTLTTYYV